MLQKSIIIKCANNNGITLTPTLTRSDFSGDQKALDFIGKFIKIKSLLFLAGIFIAD
jgi:hypothetical protein